MGSMGSVEFPWVPKCSHYVPICSLGFPEAYGFTGSYAMYSSLFISFAREACIWVIDAFSVVI